MNKLKNLDKKYAQQLQERIAELRKRHAADPVQLREEIMEAIDILEEWRADEIRRAGKGEEDDNET